ncbi:hypothetical protein R6Q59_030709, partial [Mikania micrantha]
KFTKVDNENTVKEVEVIEGGFLDMGFDLYRIRIEIKENPKDECRSCFVKLTIEYEVTPEFAANASLVTTEPLIGIMNVASKHLLESRVLKIFETRKNSKSEPYLKPEKTSSDFYFGLFGSDNMILYSGWVSDMQKLFFRRDTRKKRFICMKEFGFSGREGKK